jgi:hypothetical protein
MFFIGLILFKFHTKKLKNLHPWIRVTALPPTKTDFLQAQKKCGGLDRSMDANLSIVILLLDFSMGHA